MFNNTRRKGLLQILLGAFLISPSVGRANCNVVNGKAYGNCSGVTVNSGRNPYLKVRGDVSETGIISGAEVFAGATLVLSGICNGNIIVRKDARVYILGIVSGTIQNFGGVVSISGTASAISTSGGEVEVNGIVGSFSGNGFALFRAGSVLGKRGFNQEHVINGKRRGQ
jgi:hypothetical protein